MTALAILRKAEIIEHLARGGKLDDLHLGISRQAISKALKDDTDYQDAMVEYHAARLDNAEQAILDAAEQVDVARARALHSAYAWRASRECRAIYGDRQDVAIDASITVVLAASDSQGRIIEGEARRDGGDHAAGGGADKGTLGVRPNTSTPHLQITDPSIPSSAEEN